MNPKKYLKHIIDKSFEDYGFFLGKNMLEKVYKILSYRCQYHPKHLKFWCKKIPEIMYNSGLYADYDLSYENIYEVAYDFISLYMEDDDIFPCLEEKIWYKDVMSTLRCRYGLEKYFPYGRNDLTDILRDSFKRYGWELEDDMIDYINEEIDMRSGPRLQWMWSQELPEFIHKGNIISKPHGINKEVLLNAFYHFEYIFNFDVTVDDEEYSEMVNEAVENFCNIYK